MLSGTLIPQPLLLWEKGRKPHIIFLFPSPAGEGLGVRALQCFLDLTAILKHQDNREHLTLEHLIKTRGLSPLFYA